MDAGGADGRENLIIDIDIYRYRYYYVGEALHLCVDFSYFSVIMFGALRKYL